MKKLDTILCLLVDVILTISIIPITCMVYTIYLIYICAKGEADFKKEFTEFGYMIVKHFIGSFEFHKGRILGD